MTGATWPLPPSGFRRIDAGPAALYAREDLAAELVAAGLAARSVWSSRLDEGKALAGRGRTGTLDLPCGARLLLKELRRGGLAGRIVRASFRGAERLLANLTLPASLARRGVPTPLAAAFLLSRTGPGLFGGTLAVERIEGAEDLGTRLARGGHPDDDLRAALDVVARMHEAGFRHRDLNLGNLLLRGRPPEAWVIDLDGGALENGPLGAWARARGLARLERSYVKRFGEAGPLGPGGGSRFWEGYAAGDPALRRSVFRLRWTGRIEVSWHRMGWRLAGRAPREGGA